MGLFSFINKGKMYRTIILGMILLWFRPTLTSAQYGTEIDIIVDNGFDIVTGDENQRDTINLSAIISGEDKTSFFLDQYGDTINHKALKGKVLLLDFWFLDCKPCVAEITGFDLISSKFKGKPFKVLSFCLDEYDELNDKLLSKRNFKFSIISDARLIGKIVYPLKILLDKRGVVRDIKNSGSIAPRAHYDLRDGFSPIIKKWLYK